jgi:PST family polysaccharide transporter
MPSSYRIDESIPGSMNLIKTSLLNGIAVAVKLLTALGLNKILAIYVGPAGYAVIGQFQNAVTMIASFASAGINTGVTKYTAEFFDDEEQQQTVWCTAGTIAVGGALLASIGIAIFHQPLARIFLNNKAYGSVFLWLAATLILFVLNSLLLAILNGKKEIHRYVTVNIAGSLVSLIVTGILASVWGLYGALVALVINQSIVFIVTLAICWQSGWFRFTRLVGRIDPATARNLGKFMLMALTTASVGPATQIIIRDHMATSFGWEAAGHWQAVLKISDMYLMLVTSTLAVYYLPRISEIHNASELKREIYQGYKIILPLTILGAGGIYLLRDWIVVTIFTTEFAPIRGLFKWQLMGDVVKIGSWLLAYVMLGKAMAKTFIITEILFSAGWVGLVWVMTGWFGQQGAQMGYFANYLLYWMVMGALMLRKTRQIAALSGCITNQITEIR